MNKFYITVGPEAAERIDNWDDGRHDEKAETADTAETFDTGAFTRDPAKTNKREGKVQFGYAVDFDSDNFENFKKTLESNFGRFRDDYLENPQQLDMANLFAAMENRRLFVIRLSAGEVTTGELRKIFGDDILTVEGKFGKSAKPPSGKPLNRICLRFDRENITEDVRGRLQNYIDWISVNLKKQEPLPDEAVFKMGPDYFNLYLFAENARLEEKKRVKDGPWKRISDRRHINRYARFFLDEPRVRQSEEIEREKRCDAIQRMAEIPGEGRNLPERGLEILRRFLNDRDQAVVLEALKVYTLHLLDQPAFEAEEIFPVAQLLLPSEVEDELDEPEDQPPGGQAKKPADDPVVQAARASLNELFQKNPRSLNEALLSLIPESRTDLRREIWGFEGRRIDKEQFAPHFAKFVPFIADDDQDIADDAVVYLKAGFNLDPNRPDVVDLLMEHLWDDREVRLRVLDLVSYAVKKKQKLNEDVLNRLCGVYRKGEKEQEEVLSIIENAALNGQKLPERVINLIIHELNDIEPDSPLPPQTSRLLNILAVAVSFGQRFLPGALETLRRFFSNPDPEVKEGVVRIFYFAAMNGEKGLVEADYIQVSRSPDGQFRLVAAKGLGTLAKEGEFLSPPALAFLERSLNDPHRIDMEPLLVARRKDFPNESPNASRASVLDQYEEMNVTHWALWALQFVSENGQSLPSSMLEKVKKMYDKPPNPKTDPKVAALREKPDEYTFQHETAFHILDTASKNRPPPSP